MFRKIVFVLGLVVALVAVTSCAQPAAAPIDVQVTLSEFKIEASPASVPANRLIKFTVTNKGTLEHEMVVEPKGANDKALEGKSGAPAEADNIAVGQTKTLEWTFTEPGELQLACHVPGHYDAGMVTNFTVTK